MTNAIKALAIAITLVSIAPFNAEARSGGGQQGNPPKEPAETCGNGGWCPSTDRGGASSTLTGGTR